LHRDEWEDVELYVTSYKTLHKYHNHHTFLLDVEYTAEASKLLIPPVSDWTVCAWDRQWTSHIDANDEDSCGEFNPGKRGHTQSNWIMNETT
jgi:hypothetical protein